MPDAGPAVLGRILSVNVGRVRRVEHHGRTAETGIWKAPTPGRVTLRGVNLEGDDQADRTVHGGPDKAVYAYGRNDYEWWEGEFAQEVPPGTFGENLTLSGIDLNAAVVGERWSVGSTVLEVRQPRSPCWKLGLRMGDSHFPARFGAAGRPGAYLAVVTEGDLGAGNEVVLVARPGHGVTIGLVQQAFDDPSLAPTLLRAPELPAGLRRWVSSASGC